MADVSKNNGAFGAKVTKVGDVIDLCPLIGFAVTGLKKVEGDGIYITLNNGRNCSVEVLYDGRSLFVTAPFGIDRDGNRI